MLSPGANPPFNYLPGEHLVLTSPPRVAFFLTTPAHYPARQQQPYSLTYPKGTLYLTNRRIIYLPDKPTETFKSFASPVLNLHDSHVTSPLFGAPTWTALCQPVQGGGIPTPSSGVLELKCTFKEAGAYDWHTKYEQLRERLQQVIEVSRIDDGDGSRSSRSGAALAGIDVSNVTLDELPAYQEESDGPLISPIAVAVVQTTSPVVQQQSDSGVSVVDSPNARPGVLSGHNASNPPNVPPPAYEETQLAGLQDEVEARLNQSR